MCLQPWVLVVTDLVCVYVNSTVSSGSSDLWLVVYVSQDSCEFGWQLQSAMSESWTPLIALAVHSAWWRDLLKGSFCSLPAVTLGAAWHDGRWWVCLFHRGWISKSRVLIHRCPATAVDWVGTCKCSLNTSMTGRIDIIKHSLPSASTRVEHAGGT